MTTASPERGIVPGLRWSTAATICPRQAVYAALGAEADPLPEHVERRFMRGARLGRMMAEEVAETLRARGRTVHVEHEAPWPVWRDPVGTGHADLYAEGGDEEPEVIEIVSSKGAALPPRKPLQAAGYALHRLTRRARILAVDPSTNEERVYPVNVDALSETVYEIERAVVNGVVNGIIPDRVAAHPDEWPCMECPFARACYRDWEPPPAGRLPGHEEDVARLVDIEREAKRARKISDALDAERKGLRAKLRPLMKPSEDYIENGVKVRYAQVRGRRTLDFAAMEEAGYSLPEYLEPFVTEAGGYDRWTVKELENGR